MANNTTLTNSGLTIQDQSDSNVYNYSAQQEIKISNTDTSYSSITPVKITTKSGTNSGEVNIRTDSEGGNINITGPAGTYEWEADSYDNETLRLHQASKHPSGIGTYIWSLDGSNGKTWLPGAIKLDYTSLETVDKHGESVYNSSECSWFSGAVGANEGSGESVRSFLVGLPMGAMFTMEILIYAYNIAGKIIVSGYSYSDNYAWHAPGASAFLSKNDVGFQVRLGKGWPNSNYKTIQIYATGSQFGNYPTFAVTGYISHPSYNIPNSDNIYAAVGSDSYGAIGSDATFTFPAGSLMVTTFT